MKNLTYAEKHLLENQDRPAIVFFTSDGCHLCVALKPILDKLSKEYSSDFNFYKVNISKEKELSDKFLPEGEGVPTGFVITDQKVFKIKDPESSDSKSWYPEGYLRNILDLIK